jgi:hypothetical protein
MPESAAISILSDAFGRIHELVEQVTDGLTDQVARYRPDPQANSIAWLIWHASRVQDDHIADAAGTEQVWPQWRDKFGLPFDDFETGYGQSAEEVGKVAVSANLLVGYHSEVHEATLRYVQGLTSEELERVVDDSWDPPVTVGVRLISVISDCLQHLGQAAYVRGLAERR